MKAKPEKSSGKRKRPYVKPEVKQVPLRPEEAVLGNCKGTSSSGPTGSGCNTLMVYCSSAGS
jgi:hypothetical protein